MRTGLPAGTYRSSDCAPLGYWNCHAHFCAVALMSKAFFGAV